MPELPNRRDRNTRASRRRLLAAMLPLALPGLPGLARAAGTPARVALSYALSRSGLELARIEERFESGDGRYRLLSEARAVGLAAAFARGQSWRRESSGQLDEGSLRPSFFVDQRGQQPAQRARFDWAGRRVIFERLSASGDEPAGEAALPEGAVDRLSFPYALGLRAPPSGEWEVVIADGRRLTPYRYRVVGRESVQVPAGAFDTLHVARVPGRGESGTDVWVSASPVPVPVRIRVTEPDGAVFDQTLLGLTRA